MVMTDLVFYFIGKLFSINYIYMLIIYVGGYYSYDPTLQLSIVAITFVFILFNYLLLLNLCII